MTAGVIVLLGLLAVWIGVTGRGRAMWIALTSMSLNLPQQKKPGQPF